MTQRDKILKLFEGGGWVKVQEMNPIAYRYGAIIFNLKKEGYVFQKRKQQNSTLEEWRLMENMSRTTMLVKEKKLFIPISPMLSEATPITSEQAEAVRKRLSAIKEHHGQI